jgi:C-terminal processing protease CtpA/Prc
MNSVSKVFTQKIVITILIPLLLITVAVFPVSAQQCATINFPLTERDGKEYVALIVGHNDEMVEKYDNKDEISTGQHNYYLAEGRHTLVIEQWPLSKYKKLRHNNRIHKRYLPVQIHSQVVQVNVIDNQHYQFEFFADEDNSTWVNLKTEASKDCVASKKKVFRAKKENLDVSTSTIAVLPEPLEYRLRRMMTKVAVYQKNTEKNKSLTGMPLSNIIPTQFNQIIGTVIDENYSLDGKALKVLSVLPYSLANKLKLLSGDLITHLNDTKIQASDQSPNQQFSRYFSGLVVGEKIKITIVRDNKKQQLRGEYVPIISPEVTYQLSEDSLSHHSPQTLINNTQLSGQISLELDQLVLELNDYYNEQGLTQPFIQISRDQSFDRNIGLSGNKVFLNDEVGLAIENVDQDSFAEKFGLKQADVLVKINNIAITEANIAGLVKSLSQLRVGEKISLTINRVGEYLTLTDIYQPLELLAFTLNINLYSGDNGLAMVEKLQKAYKDNYLRILRQQNSAQNRPTFYPQSYN